MYVCSIMKCIGNMIAGRPVAADPFPFIQPMCKFLTHMTMAGPIVCLFNTNLKIQFFPQI